MTGVVSRVVSSRRVKAGSCSCRSTRPPHRMMASARCSTSFVSAEISISGRENVFISMVT